MAFPRAHRLTARHDIDSVFKKGQTVHGSFFFIRYLPNKSRSARIAISISKNVARTAVRRNALRRIYTNLAVMHRLRTVPIDGVIVITKSIVGKAREEIKRDFEINIKKLC